MAFKFDNGNSQIGEGSVFEGKFYINGSLQISGKFEGEIHTEDHLYITESGKVKTNIKASKVTIGGTLIGNIEAMDEVNVLNTGRIMGNISTPNLHLEKGAVTKGEISLTGGQSKEIGKLVKDSYTSTPGFDHYTKGEGKDKSKK